MQDKDIVEDILSRVRKILGNQFTGDIALKLECEELKIRQAWGGTEPYIAKSIRRDKIKRQVLQHINHGVSVRQVAKENGISRAQVYNLLRRK